MLGRIHAVQTNPHPLPAPQPSRQAGDPLLFTNGEGNLRWHRVRVTEQGSETDALQLSSPRSERGGSRRGALPTAYLRLRSEMSMVTKTCVELVLLIGLTFGAF